MAGPWERYRSADGAAAGAAAAGKPWERFKAADSAVARNEAAGMLAPGNLPERARSGPSQPLQVAAGARAGAQGAIDAGIRSGAPYDSGQGLTATVLNAAALGYGDELAAATKGGIDYALSGFADGEFSRSYDETLGRARGQRRQFADDNPILAPVLEITAGIGTAGPALARAVTAPASLGTRAARAAGVGAGYGAVQGFGEGEGGFVPRVVSGATGAALGGVLGAGAEGAATAFARVWRAAARRSGTPPRMVDPDTGNPTDEALNLAREAGVEIDQLSPEVLQRMDAAAARGAVAGAPGAEATTVAAALPVEVPLTRGQATNDVNALMEERALLRGGGEASTVMRDFRDRQEGALAANIPAIQERMGGGRAVDRGVGASAAQARLVEMEAAERSRVNALYDEARRLDEEGAMSRAPRAPVDEGDLNRMSPAEELEFDRARNDVTLARGGNDARRKAIIRTIQEMGGVRTRGPGGELLPEAGDLAAIFDKSVPPGFINNGAKGRGLDYVLESLGEMGWFGNRDPQTVSTADLLDMIRDKSAHPESIRGDPRLRQEQDSARSDLAELGVTGRTSADAAAARLAGARAGGRTGEDPDRLEDLRSGFDAVDDAPFLDESRSAATGFEGDLAGQVLGRVYNDLQRGGHYLRTLPGIRAELSDLTRQVNETGALPIGRAFEALKNLTKEQKKFGSQEAVAAGVAKRRIEQEIDEALEQGLLAGDEAVIDAFRTARREYAGFADRFKRKDLVGLLVRRDPGRGNELKVDPSQAVNAIFGTADTGMVKKGDLNRDLTRMRELLGADSPVWNDLRQEAWMKIANRAQTGSGPTGRIFSGANVAKAWEDFARDNRELVATLFSPAERRDIGNFVNIARRVTTPDRAVYAPSISSFEQSRILERLFGATVRRIPFLGKWADAILESLRGVQRTMQAREVAAGRLRAPAQPRRALETADALQGLGVVGGTQLLGGP